MILKDLIRMQFDRIALSIDNENVYFIGRTAVYD
jgi:hypothetical protein